MPDNIEKQRLKKKMLDRWENEGGRIVAVFRLAKKGVGLLSR